MNHETLLKTNPIVKMDENHINLIYSLIICSKPKKTLEIGVGSGAVTKVILDAYNYNNISPNITCVDNFVDWGHNAPQDIKNISEKVRFFNLDEKTFIHNHHETYDFIISDADHHHTNEWVDKTLSALNTGGILIYHDILNKDFPNLLSIIPQVDSRWDLKCMIFGKSSLENERCERGLMVINKIW